MKPLHHYDGDWPECCHMCGGSPANRNVHLTFRVTPSCEEREVDGHKVREIADVWELILHYRRDEVFRSAQDELIRLIGTTAAYESSWAIGRCMGRSAESGMAESLKYQAYKLGVAVDASIAPPPERPDCEIEALRQQIDALRAELLGAHQDAFDNAGDAFEAEGRLAAIMELVHDVAYMTDPRLVAGIEKIVKGIA